MTNKLLKGLFRFWWRPVLFLVFAGGIFLLLFMVPVWTTPGNDLLFQLSITPIHVLFSFILLSLLNGVLILEQIEIRYLSHQQAVCHKQTVGEKVSFLGILSSAFFATIACAACYSTLLSFLGVGVIGVFVQYRTWIAFASVVITIYALYKSSQRLLGVCNTCPVK